MFERYTESARRALFFARYEVTQRGGLTIEPEHLLLGILRAAPDAIMRFARSTASKESLRRDLESGMPSGETVSTSAEIPFSRDCKHALEQTAVEADAANNAWIGPEHVVLAVMVKTEALATRVLHDAGVTVDAIRVDLAGRRGAPRDAPASAIGARSSAPGMISREWKGVVKRGREDEYIAHLRRETLPSLARLEGFVTASVLRRDVADGTEFEVTTVWRTASAIEAFAGGDSTKAVVPPAAQDMMVRYDDRAVHYEIVQ